MKYKTVGKNSRVLGGIVVVMGGELGDAFFICFSVDPRHSGSPAPKTYFQSLSIIMEVAECRWGRWNPGVVVWSLCRHVRLSSRQAHHSVTQTLFSVRVARWRVICHSPSYLRWKVEFRLESNRWGVGAWGDLWEGFITFQPQLICPFLPLVLSCLLVKCACTGKAV